MKQQLRLALGCVVLLAGCASQPEKPDDTLNDAQAAIATAESSDAVADYAPVELAKAREQLKSAENALAADNKVRAEHFALLAQRHAEIALASAQAANAKAATKRIAKQREQLRLQVRESELSEREHKVKRQQREIDQLREQLSELKPKKTERGIVLTIGNVLFAFDSAELNASAQSPLDRLASFLKEHPDRRIRVEGHTDSIGSDSYNQKLSEERAQSVASAMIHRGIEPERMTVVGYGENRPVTSNDTESGRQQNRRVEFVILNK